MASHKQYTDLQVFTMAYLASEEQNQEERGLVYGHESTFGMPISHRYTTSISELSLKLPPHVIPNKPSGNEILSEIEEQIRGRRRPVVNGRLSAILWQSHRTGPFTLRHQVDYLFENITMV